MKVQLFTLLVGVIAYANLIYQPPTAEQAQPDPIDFASLHSQAASALQSLQSARQDRAVIQ